MLAEILWARLHAVNDEISYREDEAHFNEERLEELQRENDLLKTLYDQHSSHMHEHELLSGGPYLKCVFDKKISNAKLHSNIDEFTNLEETIFQDGLKQLKNFINREHHSRVPQGHIENGFQLGNWTHYMRNQYMNGNLSGDQIKQLEIIQDWAWKGSQIYFEDGLNALITFEAREGHARINPGHKEGDFLLGSWVREIRHQFENNALSDKRITILETFNDWRWDPLESLFDRGFKELKRFYSRNGHTKIPDSYQQGNFNIGRWATRIRHEFIRDQLTTEQIQKMESIGDWRWSLALPKDNFESAVESIIATSNSPLTLSEIEIKLREKKIRIPGLGNKANIVTRLTRSPDRFIRVAPGTYGLVELDHKPIKQRFPTLD